MFIEKLNKSIFIRDENFQQYDVVKQNSLLSLSLSLHRNSKSLSLAFEIFHPFSFSSFFLHHYRRDCKRCVVIYEKHQNVLQYKESECELEQNKPASAAISSVIRSDYNTDSRFQGNEQYMDAESTYIFT